MESVSGEIILHDLLAWEPRLELLAPGVLPVGMADPLEREVEWVLTARANAPMLPFIRGGELVILPSRIIHETGIPFIRLINELMMHPIAGILAEGPLDDVPPGPLALLTLPTIDAETESDLNRLLASRRRDLMQVASETDRLIADAVEREARPGQMIDAISQHLRVPISVLTNYGAVLFSTGIGADTIPQDARSSRAWLHAGLKADQTLWLGPIPPESHANARVTIGRIRQGIQRLLDRDASAAPHGSARSLSLNALLLPEPGTPRDAIADQAFRAGIPPGRTLHVALAPRDLPEGRVRRLLAPLGEVHDAGLVDGYRAHITIATPVTIRNPLLSIDTDLSDIALSAPLATARDLPEGARQARYLARLLAARAIAGPVARFEDDAHLGIYRLLYSHWGSSMLTHFQLTMLGPLQDEDRHGTLQHTLRVFLEEGGSLRPTAERLGIHRNTLAYRLKQIRSIVDVDLDSPQVRLSLHIALIAGALPRCTDRSGWIETCCSAKSARPSTSRHRAATSPSIVSAAPSAAVTRYSYSSEATGRSSTAATRSGSTPPSGRRRPR